MQPESIVIQEIVTIWTEESRGGEGARLRNAVASVLPLPASLQRIAHGVVYHSVSCHERNAFAPRDEIAGVLPSVPERLRCLRLEEEEELLVVLYQWESACGAPRRDEQPPQRIAQVHRGELVRVVYNGRFSGEDFWWYQQVVTNVAFGIEPATLVAQAVKRTVDLRAALR
ncbi:MAG TPA: hypothetical protein VF824_15600 [Thermoanaerobaculia bacterium]|jgi:hypothetical protein